MSEPLKIGMVGLDTSHCTAFVDILNQADNAHHVPGGRIVAAYPGFSEAVAVSRNRVAGFRQKIEEAGIQIADTIADLAGLDAYFLENVDGRQHAGLFEQLAAFGKPVFVDKPLACSHADAARMAALAEKRGAPLFSTSSIRYAAGLADLVEPGAVIKGCDAFGPTAILEDYPAYFWYGVHSADVLFSKMGRGCREVRTLHRPDCDVIAGFWDDGRIGTIRGNRFNSGVFGCTVFTDKGVRHGQAISDPPYYAMLLKEVIAFFRTGRAPLDIRESLEVTAFLEAADKSRQLDGAPVVMPG